MYTHFKILHTGRTYNTGLKQYTTWKHAQTQIFAFHFIRFTPSENAVIILNSLKTSSFYLLHICNDWI